MQAAAVRQQIEQTLQRRVAGALTPRLRQGSERLSTGIPALDTLLGGGLPLGAISELVGGESSGRTAVALSFIATRLAKGEVAAWIDASDSLDPESAASLGVPLEQMLWVRCGSAPTSRQTRQEIFHAASQTTSAAMDPRGVSLDRALSVPAQSGGCGSPHPRSEARGLPEALQTLIGEAGPPSRTHAGGNRGLVPPRRRDKSIGTPSAPNRSLTATPGRGKSSHESVAAARASAATPSVPAGAVAGRPSLHWRSPHREEQVATDRLPARRGEQVTDRGTASWSPRCGEPQPHPPPHVFATATQPRTAGEPCSELSGISAHITSNQASVPHATDAARIFFKKLSENSDPAPRRASSGSLRGMDQALRAADLLLQSSGFGVVVLDLASFPPELVWRIPLSTWFRFRAAAERSRTCLLLLTQHPCARSSADLVVAFHAHGFVSSGSVMTGIHWQAAVSRERFAAPPPIVVSIRKPPQSEPLGAWAGAAPWTSPSATGTTTPQHPAAGSGSLDASFSAERPAPAPRTATEGHAVSNLAAFPRRLA